MVTGAGGTIGSELVRQLAALGPSEIVLLDHAEYNLYAIDMEMREKFPDIPVVPQLCCIRQRDRIMQIFAHHRPELVFHAADIGRASCRERVCQFVSFLVVAVSLNKQPYISLIIYF